MATKVTEKDEATIKPKKERPRASATARTASSRNNVFGRMSHYLREVQTELRKTSWPTRAEMIASTQVVLGLLVVIGIYIWLVDVALYYLFQATGLGFKK